MSEPLRLFLAVYPPSELKPALSRLAVGLQQDCGGRPVAPEALHLTLAFLGDTAAERLPALQAALAALKFAPFTLCLARLARWDNGVVWLGLAQDSPALAELAQAVRTALEQAGLGFDRKRFTPHLTLLRRSVRAVPATVTAAFEWTVRDFALVQSQPGQAGSSYRDLARFAASAAGD
ncbi:RNA 2',3'-cyclic phosphodiesterase [Chitinimonas lacunae]|uniref:RNA 2',3'-cyclic phosphodiesterase n=1 Tax=Chitinimonas lacunae TaxID=1963018 RepID=A0ABV8ML41_9NEIS